MTLQELRYIVAVADQAHFGKAAEQCFISQSTLSAQIRKLEDYLNVVIFDRSSRQVRTTPMGTEIIRQARDILTAAAHLKETARNTKQPLAGALHLGVIPTLSPYYLPHLLPTLQRECPELKLYLRELTTAECLRELNLGRLDAALLALPIMDAALHIEPLFIENFLFAMPANHENYAKLSAQENIAPKNLPLDDLLLLEEGHCLRDQALAACNLLAHQRQETFKATSLETLRQMVALGVGCTLLPALAADSHPMLVLKPFAEPAPHRQIGLVSRAKFARNETILLLANLLRAHLPPETKAVV